LSADLFDLVIRGGTVVDGSGGAPERTHGDRARGLAQVFVNGLTLSDGDATKPERGGQLLQAG